MSDVIASFPGIDLATFGKEIETPLMLQAEYLHLTLEEYLGYIIKAISATGFQINFPAMTSPYGYIGGEIPIHFEFFINVTAPERQKKFADQRDAELREKHDTALALASMDVAMRQKDLSFRSEEEHDSENC